MYTAEYYLVDIASALIGLSYPFIYQIIENIDKKYGSLHVVSLFKDSWVFKTYNVLLSLLMVCVLTMPFVWKECYKDSILIYPSLESVSIFLLAITLICLVILFRRIGTFYDYIGLHDLIRANLQLEIEFLPCKLNQLRDKANLLSKKIENAPKSEYWISDSEIMEMGDRLERVNIRIKTIEHQIANGTNSFNCLVDLIEFAIKENHSDLFFRANATFGECLKAVVDSHQTGYNESR